MMERLHAPKKHQMQTRECDEVGVWSKAVGWRENEYHQLGKGRFEARFNVSLCDDLRVVDQYFSRELIATGIAPADRIALLIPQNGDNHGIFNGRTLQKDECMVMGPGVEGTYRTPPHLRMLGIHLPISRLINAFESLGGQELSPLICQSRVIKLSQKSLGRLIRLAHQVIITAPGEHDAPVPALWQQELQSSIVTSLVSGLSGGDEREPGRLARANRLRYFTFASDYIHAHLEDKLDIETITRATGVSPRSLEYAFREICDTTPLQYIKIRRLHEVRRRLLSSTGPMDTVSSIALQYGLSHFSYFARDYHSLFDEYPSESLAKRIKIKL